ncbi:MAG TPA: dienelactone hydrolase family protein, partial [Gemmata sp.]
MKTACHRLFLLVFLVALAAVPLSAAEPLPNTKPLTEEGNLAEKQVAGMHKYLDRALADAPQARTKLWKLDTSSPDAYAKSVEPNRARLGKYLGTVGPRVAPKLEYASGPGAPALVATIDECKVLAVRWAVLPGVDAEGLLIEPKGTPVANLVAVPDADQIPEQIAGVIHKDDKTGVAGFRGLAEELQFARVLAAAGCRVLVPSLIDRKDHLSGNAKLNRATNLPHREFVQRMAYEMGRTVAGYETQKVLAAVDWFTATDPKRPIGAVGYGEGGRIALYAAALDTRVRATIVCGAFGPREALGREPLDRNIWGQLTEFGDAELGLLVAPRLLFVAPVNLRANWAGHQPDSPPVPGASDPWPKFDGPVVGKPGKSNGAAPGTLDRPDGNAIRGERKRMTKLTGGKHEPGTIATHESTVSKFVGELTGQPNQPAKEIDRAVPKVNLPDPAARHQRQFDQLVSHTQKLWRDSDATRKAYWKNADASSPEAWEKSCEPYREHFHAEVIGKLPEPTVPLNPRTRRVYDEKTWTGYEVVLDVYDDVFATGILLLPKDLKPGEKRPVVVCQHGLEGTPRDTIEIEKRPVYNHFSRRLVELGYIVYAPQNPYYGKNVFRQLQRKANPLKLSLFSFIIRQHQRTLDWLETLPNVDAKRIAFYGLSYGGKTAMRVPAVEKRYCLSICSGDFNEWIGKNVSVGLDRSYMWTGEYEMYEFDLGNTFNYAEMAFLIAPRPFMVERGHDDGVGTDEMVAYEFAKVRYLYANRLKLPERTTIEFFPGGHQINAEGTFAFLKKHLGHP